MKNIAHVHNSASRELLVHSETLMPESLYEAGRPRRPPSGLHPVPGVTYTHILLIKGHPDTRARAHYRSKVGKQKKGYDIPGY